MQKLILVLAFVAATAQAADLPVALKKNLMGRFNSSEQVLLQNLRQKFEAWRDSSSPDDHFLMNETHRVIEKQLTTLYKKCERLVNKVGSFADQIPKETELAIQKKFNSTGHKMRDEIIAAFNVYLGDRDEAKLFDTVGQIVPRRMAHLADKVGDILVNVKEQTKGNSKNNNNKKEEGGMTPELEGNIKDMFNTTKDSLLANLQSRFEAWLASPNPSNKALITETTNVIEQQLTNLYQSGEQYVMESGNYDTDSLPEDAKVALEKKFNSTGYKMRDEIVEAFRKYLQDGDQQKLFDFVRDLVPKRMDVLNEKVEEVVGKAQNFEKPSTGGGASTGNKKDELSDKSKNDLASKMNQSLDRLLQKMQSAFTDWQSHGKDAKLVRVVENTLKKHMKAAKKESESLLDDVKGGAVPKGVKKTLEKKFTKTGDKLISEVKAAFETFVQDKDQGKLFSQTDKVVRMRFGNLEKKVQDVVKQVE